MLITGICLSLALSSCLKSKQTYYNPPVALVSFFQASPDQPPMDLYFDNNRVNWNPIPYGSGLDYFGAYPGLRTINFYEQNTMSKIFSDTVTLKQNYFYSLFLANQRTNPEIVLLTDTLSKPPANMASIRFVDLSPDAPAADLVLNDTLKIATNKIFKGHSSFVPLAGNATYNLEVRQTGTSTVLASLPNLTLNTNMVYTIIFDGLAASTGSTDKLNIFYVINAQYF